MYEYFTNNPMMEMFKKSMAQPMNMWSAENWNKQLENLKNLDVMKNFNPENWLSLSNKMMENSFWTNFTQPANHFNPVENIKKVEAFADIHKLSLENAQAVLRRQAEIVQKHVNELYKLMQNMASATSPEAAMSLQSEYIKSAFDSLSVDIKELLQMCSKANLETFDSTRNTMSEHLHNMNTSCKGKEHGTEQEVYQTKSKKDAKN